MADCEIKTAPPSSPMASAAWLGWVFAMTILVSAFLLFQVQPLVSKFILPWFGGSPAVWTTCMLFFQVLLFGGYAYAHFAERWFPPAVQAIVHLALLAGALVWLPIAPDPSWKPLDAADPTWRILGLLATTVGLPYLILSATGPLVQSWFSRTFPGRSPYRLYALSNFGSLAALLSYPFCVEPAMALGQQTHAWSWGFGLFVAACGGSALATWRWGQPRSGTAAASTAPDQSAPNMSRWLAWILLPGLASLALLATTNHVCQDLAVIPFLWVMPLSLYLLSFIVAFDHERWYLRRLFAPAVAAAAVVLSGLDQLHFELSFAMELSLYFGGLFCLCMLCHGELVRLRPAPRYLTSFYLAIAAGGALGGVCVSLLAPAVFSTYLEWKLTLIAGYGLALWLLVRSGAAARTESQAARRGMWFRGGALAVAGVAGLTAIAHFQSWFGGGLERTRTNDLYNADYRCSVLASTRNFYGVNTVLERQHRTDPSLNDRAMFSGQIPHGVQLTAAARRRQATTYYGPATGVGRALAWWADRPDARVGIIGLGVGTLVTYAAPGHSYRCYEINPAVDRLARRFFWNLEDCRGMVEVVPGDARLSLDRETPQGFHVLVLDAFSGDAVPTHLLTKEAFAIYRKHLANDGVIAIHISNGYLDLAPVVRGLAQDSHLELLRVRTRGDDKQTLYRADWMLLTQNAAFLRAHATAAESADDAPPSILWTDDHSNLFEILQ